MNTEKQTKRETNLLNSGDTDKKAVFFWPNEKSNELTINKKELIEGSYAIFFLVTNDGGNDFGRLKGKKDYDDFVEYLVALSKQKHNMKKLTIVTLADDMATEMNF